MDGSWRVVRIGAHNLAECRTGGIPLEWNQIGGGVGVLVVGNKVAWRVGDVEEFGAQLQPEALRHLEILKE